MILSGLATDVQSPEPVEQKLRETVILDRHRSSSMTNGALKKHVLGSEILQWHRLCLRGDG